MFVRLLHFRKTMAVVKTIILILLSLLCASYLNFFSSMTFIPKDQVFAVGLTFYIAVMELVWQWISEILKEKVIAKLHIFISNSNEPKTNKEDVTCSFPELDTSFIHGEIRINCPPKRLRMMSIVIVFPPWVIVQQNMLNDKVVEVISPHVCKIKLTNIIENEITEQVISKYKFKLVLLKNIPESTFRIDKVECRLEYNRKKLDKYFTEFIINNRLFLKSK